MILENRKTYESCQVVKIKPESREFEIIWVADMHSDSKKSQKNFLDMIIKEKPNAYLVFGGDSFDVMQNIRDPRASKSALKDSLKRDDYINAVIEEAYDYFYPYREKILAFNLGNHDETQIRMHGIDIIKLLVDKLNAQISHEIICGDLAGWIKLQVYNTKTQYFSRNIYFSHHPITGGTRSKGALSIDLAKGRYPDADIIISEHIHTSFIHPFVTERFTGQHDLKYINRYYVQMPTLKDEFSGKKRGYIHAKRFEATPIGVAILNFTLSKSDLIIETPSYKFLR